MNEEKKEETAQAKVEREAEGILQRSISAAERLERANAATAILVERMERVASLNMLGGKAEAIPEPTKQTEETPKEYAARIMRGGK